ncbi:MAG: c-type cytochrome, partial [Rhodothermales bacterium]|nr:c-type cytochrome [Rhodothermales bacterium]
KNWIWHNDFKIPNGVHVFGRRHEPFGPDNYPAELIKIREMTAIRDTAIWLAARGQSLDLVSADRRTTPLPPVETNYELDSDDPPVYLYGDDALATFHTAPGYRIDLFASEREFPELANPVQLSFDNHGRLWVATMPSYPHYRPGDPKPDDKLIILEDLDGDGKADRQKTFADGLHLPTGFELGSGGVFVAQGTNLIWLGDTDGDDRADVKDIVLSGFDDHDTHHTISAFTAGPSGAIYMAEGIFLHSNVETAYGPVRATNGGFFRYDPRRRYLERTAQLDIPNPWGIAFDEWGQPFFAETSGPDVRWMLPGTIKPLYGAATHKSFNLIEEAHLVRPTSGLEFVSSRHFPDEVQGDLLINNTIGFRGTKQHAFLDDGTGYASRHRQDLVWSDDGNFRPVDMEFAPDGSLYIVDWHNVLVGHMQHNARDPLRDHAHGRIYRVTYPARPLVEPARVAGADIQTLLENLKLPEYRARYRTRRELRGRPSDAVLEAMTEWLSGLDAEDPRYEHHLLEALWVSWGLNRIDETLLGRLLEAKDHRVRAAAVRVLRYVGHQISDQVALLSRAAADDHGRVRLEAIVAGSWLPRDEGVAVVAEAAAYVLDPWILPAHTTALAHLSGVPAGKPAKDSTATHLEGVERDRFELGREIYARDGYCGTCHQPDGRGLPAADFPPLAGSQWVLEDTERLIKLTLKGLVGPIDVHGTTYSGLVPMTPFELLLDDEEIAAVLTYVRNAFGNRASAVTADEVRRTRDSIENKTGFYTAQELDDGG